MNYLENVSRETISDLETYEELIRKWSSSINLVAKSTLPTLWERHINDSAAIFSLISPNTKKLTDIGSGGGLPGIVLAIMAKEKMPDIRFTLIESDQRKAAFLRATSIQLMLPIDIVSERIELSKPSEASIVTARALAPLPKLLGYVERHIIPDGIALLPKGRNHEEEVASARDVWDFDLDVFPSKHEAGSATLMVTSLREKNEHET